MTNTARYLGRAVCGDAERQVFWMSKGRAFALIVRDNGRHSIRVCEDGRTLLAYVIQLRKGWGPAWQWDYGTCQIYKLLEMIEGGSQRQLTA